MDFKGQVYREDGQWKIRLIVPDWVVDDILRDAEHSTRTLISLHDDSPYTGSSLYAGGSLSRFQGGKQPKILAMVAFEEQNVDTKVE